MWQVLNANKKQQNLNLSTNRMKNCFLVLLFLSVSFLSFAQAKSDSTVKIYASNEVDSIAVFPGGTKAWERYLAKNLDPNVGPDNGAKVGKYTVVIRFIVTREGKLKNFEPMTKMGYGMEEEVIRILKLSPDWKPATLGGNNVDSYSEKSQVFLIEEM